MSHPIIQIKKHQLDLTYFGDEPKIGGDVLAKAITTTSREVFEFLKSDKIPAAPPSKLTICMTDATTNWVQLMEVIREFVPDTAPSYFRGGVFHYWPFDLIFLEVEKSTNETDIVNLMRTGLVFRQLYRRSGLRVGSHWAGASYACYANARMRKYAGIPISDFERAQTLLPDSVSLSNLLRDGFNSDDNERMQLDQVIIGSLFVAYLREVDSPARRSWQYLIDSFSSDLTVEPDDVLRAERLFEMPFEETFKQFQFFVHELSKSSDPFATAYRIEAGDI